MIVQFYFNQVPVNESSVRPELTVFRTRMVPLTVCAVLTTVTSYYLMIRLNICAGKMAKHTEIHVSLKLIFVELDEVFEYPTLEGVMVNTCCFSCVYIWFSNFQAHLLIQIQTLSMESVKEIYSIQKVVRQTFKNCMRTNILIDCKHIWNETDTRK